MTEIGIIMGSKSDLPVLNEAVEIINKFGLSYELDIVLSLIHI